jgi:hypothetical protein
VFVLQIGSDLQFAEGPGSRSPVMRVDQLEGDLLVDVDLAGSVDRPLTALADHLEQLVVAEPLRQCLLRGGVVSDRGGDELVHHASRRGWWLPEHAPARFLGLRGRERRRFLQVGEQGVRPVPQLLQFR